MASLPDFMTLRLAEAVEKLPAGDIDRLPFGVIGLDPLAIVRTFNKTEAQQSGFGERARGKDFFLDVAPCMKNGYFTGRIEKARAAGTLDISFSFVGDFSDHDREITVRVQSASDGGTWIFHQRA